MASAAGATTAGALYALVSLTTPEGAKIPEDAADKKHHVKNGKGFMNPWPSYKEFGAFTIFKEIIGRRITGAAHVPDTSPPLCPVRKPTFLPSRSIRTLRSTWLGHACYYIEFPSGLRVLFDPVFEDCCAPISLPNLKRYTPPPCEVEDIPVIDAVVISHNHYDHLSHPTIMRIWKRHPGVRFFVPLGNRVWFEKCGIRGENVVEMDWWDGREMVLRVDKKAGEKDTSVDISTTSPAEKDPDTITAKITCLPCQHTTARTPFDKNHTLWASWSISSGGANVYFAGDTGYRTVPKLPAGQTTYSPELLSTLPTCPAFKQIGTHTGPFDLGLIPIGAYGPRHVFSAMHANPDDSVSIFKETGCRRALGMHWGTWVLTEEDLMEPPRELKRALREAGVEEEGRFDVCDVGESREFEFGG